MIIEKAWETATEIGGVNNGYEQSIDRDQVVDENGNAEYSTYYMIVDETRYEFTAEEMEAFVKTW